MGVILYWHFWCVKFHWFCHFYDRYGECHITVKPMNVTCKNVNKQVGTIKDILKLLKKYYFDPNMWKKPFSVAEINCNTNYKMSPGELSYLQYVFFFFFFYKSSIFFFFFFFIPPVFFFFFFFIPPVCFFFFFFFFYGDAGARRLSTIFISICQTRRKVVRTRIVNKAFMLQLVVSIMLINSLKSQICYHYEREQVVRPYLRSYQIYYSLVL